MEQREESRIAFGLSRVATEEGNRPRAKGFGVKVEAPSYEEGGGDDGGWQGSALQKKSYVWHHPTKSLGKPFKKT